MSAEDQRTTDEVPEWKQREVDELVDLLEAHDSVGVVNVTGIPSKQLQDMRRGLHGQAALRMSRNTLLMRALEQVGDGLADLTQYIEGEVGLVATNDNPFGLFQQLEASKTPAPINAGEVAPNDIVVPEGDTGIDPGPFVGELQTIGANARIQEGSIQVLEDSVVTEAGDVVLSELGIEPKEVGLDLRGVFSEGVLFTPDELEIDVDEYRADIESAAASARNLSINAEYPTERTAPALVAKARGEAKSLGLQAAVESPDLADDLVSKADAQVRALAAQIDDEAALPEELQDVDAPAAPAEGGDDATEDEQSDEATDSEADADDSDDDDDDDGDAGAEGLGEMFG